METVTETAIELGEEITARAVTPGGLPIQPHLQDALLWQAEPIHARKVVAACARWYGNCDIFCGRYCTCRTRAVTSLDHYERTLLVAIHESSEQKMRSSTFVFSSPILASLGAGQEVSESVTADALTRDLSTLISSRFIFEPICAASCDIQGI